MTNRICIYSFTNNGHIVKQRLLDSISLKLRGTEYYFEDADIKSLTKDTFGTNRAHVFICATGICVRKIAPFIDSKLTDPAVIVIDEKGEYVIPILSGHIGGANSIAKLIADEIGAKAVLTTATDVNGFKAIDEMAAENGLFIYESEKIKLVNSKLLRGEKIKIAHDDSIEIEATSDGCYELCELNDAEVYISGIYPKGNSFDGLYLHNKIYSVGVGCRKDIDFKVFSSVINSTLSECGVNVKDVFGIASIDIKKSESAILEYCSDNNVDFYTYSSEALKGVDGEFDESEFVNKVTGVSNVSERSAALLGGSGEFLLKRKAENGVTVSIYKMKKRIILNGNA